MRKNLLGRVFHHLTVEEVVERRRTDSGNYMYRLKTRCVCGRSHELWESDLRRQKDPTCPTCREAGGAINSDPLAKVWYGMHTRCYDANSAQYKNYGGRGVVVCDRWKRTDDIQKSRRAFQNFLADMGPRPDGFTIERRDNDGPYSPDNCLWVPNAVQQLNKRTTRRLGGDALAAIERQHGLAVGLITETAQRLSRPVEELVAALKDHPLGKSVPWKRLLGLPRKAENSQHTQKIHTPRTLRYNHPMKPPTPQQPTMQGKRRRNFYLPDQLMDEVDRIAARRETTTTDILRRALEAYVRAWKAKHGQ